WKQSPRYANSHVLDQSLPSKKYLKLVQDLNRRESALLTQLRTRHIPLNHYLFRIRRSETPVCPHCGNLAVESVHHLINECRHYQFERHRYLRRKLRQKAESLSFLFTSPAALKPLFQFIHATKRLEPRAQPDTGQTAHQGLPA
ncbi:hypothetical protein J132_07042, partial [Termitomyces sp. J132]